MPGYNELSDKELAALLRAGDGVAFTEIYNRYWEFLYKSGYGILKDSDACDDIVQEIFVWVWLNKEKQFTDSFKPYLHAAVKYKVANTIRHGKVKEAFFARAVENYHEVAVDENSVELHELKGIIKSFSESLPERARMIFQLSRDEFLTNKEIADRLGISEKTVENQMNINLKKLKHSLGKMSFWSILL
jgi:RNA polymerase sigma-70 factor (family 1)